MLRVPDSACAACVNTPWALIMRKLAAEALGTFILMFCGTAVIIANDASGNITHVGISLTWGLIVLALIYALGDVSGCHINPAVTVAFFAARRFEGRLVLPYIASQIAGAVLAVGSLRLLFPDHATLGVTQPTGPVWQSFFLEVAMTFILMFVVLCVSTGAQEKGVMAGVAVGSVIALEVLLAGPISGASMNPARSLAPALVTWNLDHLWIYLIAPFLGGLLAIGACRCVQPKGCCCKAAC